MAIVKRKARALSHHAQSPCRLAEIPTWEENEERWQCRICNTSCFRQDWMSWREWSGRLRKFKETHS